MLIVTTDGIERRKVIEYLGIVSGDAIVGAKEHAIEDMVREAEAAGADAVLAVDLDYEVVGESMPMVSANGTAVRLG